MPASNLRVKRLHVRPSVLGMVYDVVCTLLMGPIK